MNSEYGKGFVYNLVLFAKHWWKIYETVKSYTRLKKENPGMFGEQEAVEMWFYGAGDHFIEFTIPRGWHRSEIGKLAKDLQDRAMNYRLSFGEHEKPTMKDFDKFFADLERLCRMIDEKLGVKTIEADWN